MNKAITRSAVRVLNERVYFLYLNFYNIYNLKILFGLISNNDRHLRNTSVQTITNDVHNLLLLSNNTQRFELLPTAHLSNAAYMQNQTNLPNNIPNMQQTTNTNTVKLFLFIL